MTARILLSTIILIWLYGCFGMKPFQPPPPMYKSYIKENTSEEDVKNAMLQCGYPNLLGSDPSETNNEVAKKENCMFERGFSFRSGYKGICSLPGKSDLLACIKNN